MKITRNHLRRIIKEEIALINEGGAPMENPLSERSAVKAKLMTIFRRILEDMSGKDPRLSGRVQLKVKLESQLIDEAMISKYSSMEMDDIGKFSIIVRSATWNCTNISMCLEKHKGTDFMKKFRTPRRLRGAVDEEVNGEYDIAMGWSPR